MFQEVVPLANPYSHGSNPCALAINLIAIYLIATYYAYRRKYMEKYITLAKILDDVYNYFVEENVEFDLQDGTEEEIIKNIIDLIEKLIERKED